MIIDNTVYSTQQFSTKLYTYIYIYIYIYIYTE